MYKKAHCSLFTALGLLKVQQDFVSDEGRKKICCNGI